MEGRDELDRIGERCDEIVFLDPSHGRFRAVWRRIAELDRNRGGFTNNRRN
jgi:hypothetical protein